MEYSQCGSMYGLITHTQSRIQASLASDYPNLMSRATHVNNIPCPSPIVHFPTMVMGASAIHTRLTARDLRPVTSSSGTQTSLSRQNSLTRLLKNFPDVLFASMTARHPQVTARRFQSSTTKTERTPALVLTLMTKNTVLKTPFLLQQRS